MNCFTRMWLRGQLCKILVLDTPRAKIETKANRQNIQELMAAEIRDGEGCRGARGV